MLAIVMKIFYLLFIYFFKFFFYRKSSDCRTILEYSALSVLVAVISYSKIFFNTTHWGEINYRKCSDSSDAKVVA